MIVRPDFVFFAIAGGETVPTHPALAHAAAAIGLISQDTAGLTVRYGIFIRADSWSQRRLVVHELVHTCQCERLGGFEQFLRPYLSEYIAPAGYPCGQLEQEAITTAARLCD